MNSVSFLFIREIERYGLFFILSFVTICNLLRIFLYGGDSEYFPGERSPLMSKFLYSQRRYLYARPSISCATTTSGCCNYYCYASADASTGCSQRPGQQWVLPADKPGFGPSQCRPVSRSEPAQSLGSVTWPQNPLVGVRQRRR